jgi:SAM-dependent methyltransferase
LATSYGKSFFDLIREGTQRSADLVVPMILNYMKPETVVDVGCGEGWWAKAFSDWGGCEVLGIDGGDIKGPVVPFHAADLNEDFPDVGDFDLAVSLEVVEHLKPERGKDFIEYLTTLAPAVLFSAAIPCQGGIGHLNERWLEYWVKQFKVYGYKCSGALRWEMWGDERVEWWYQQNMILAARDPEKFPDLFGRSASAPFSVIHPTLLKSATGQR